MDISAGRLFYDQALGTFILVMVIFAVTDSRNASPGNAAPIVIGIAACLGFILTIFTPDFVLQVFQQVIGDEEKRFD